MLLRSLNVRGTTISGYELARRADDGDEAAKAILRRESLLPDLRELKHIVETLLLILLIIGVAALIGPWLAALVMLIVLLQMEATSRNRLVREQADKLYIKYEPKILELTAKAQPFLQKLHQGGLQDSGQFIYTKQELLDRLKTTDVLSDNELNLLEHSLAFQTKRVLDVMTPRTMIEAVSEKDTLGPIVLNKLHKSGHSRFPVYNEDIDHVVGMIYMHDLVPMKKNVHDVLDVMRHEVFYIREDQTLEHALAAFLKTKHHLFIVVNPYRETEGLLSLEDVLEALLGKKIIDEFDRYHDLRAVAEKNPRENNLPIHRKDV